MNTDTSSLAAEMRRLAQIMLDTAQMTSQYPEWLMSELAEAAQCLIEAAAALDTVTPTDRSRKFSLGDLVTKTKGSSWTGHVVGFYSTALTPVGYAVESATETGSVQIYPEAALTRVKSAPWES